MRLLVHIFLLCLALCVASSRWRHRKKNAILDWRRTLASRGLMTSPARVTSSARDVMRHQPRAHRPMKKSIVHVSEITPDGDPCALGPLACHRYSEIINANAETRETHNLDKAEKGKYVFIVKVLFCPTGWRMRKFFVACASGILPRDRPL